MKIIITSSQKTSYWYADKIGQVFDVYPEIHDFEGEKYYTLIANEHNGIGVEDCRVFNDSFKMLKSYQDQKSGEPA